MNVLMSDVTDEHVNVSFLGKMHKNDRTFIFLTKQSQMLSQVLI